MSLRRYNDERRKMRSALLAAIQAMARAQLPMDGGHAKALAEGFALVRQPEDPDLGFEPKKQSEASRIMRIR